MPERRIIQRLSEFAALPVRKLNKPQGGLDGHFYSTGDVLVEIGVASDVKPPKVKKPLFGETALIIRGNATLVEADVRPGTEPLDINVRVRGEVQDAHAKGGIHLIVDLAHGNVIEKDGGKVTQVNREED